MSSYDTTPIFFLLTRIRSEISENLKLLSSLMSSLCKISCKTKIFVHVYFVYAKVAHGNTNRGNHYEKKSFDPRELLSGTEI